jgi:hypothetical protein
MLSFLTLYIPWDSSAFALRPTAETTKQTQQQTELSTFAVALTEIQFSSPPFPEGTGVELPVRGKELGRDIPFQTRQVGFGISAAKPLC